MINIEKFVITCYDDYKKFEFLEDLLMLHATMC